MLVSIDTFKWRSIGGGGVLSIDIDCVLLVDT